MKSKLTIVLAMCALMLGLSVTGAAQVTKHRTRDGRIIYQSQTRDNRRNDRDDQRWNNQRNDRRYNDRDDRRYNDRNEYGRNNRQYNDRDDYRRNDQRNNQDWRRQNQGQVYQNQQYGARTYRLPNGRLVTILPDGRRIYR